MSVTSVSFSGAHSITPSFSTSVYSYDVVLDYFNSKPTVNITVSSGTPLVLYNDQGSKDSTLS